MLEKKETSSLRNRMVMWNNMYPFDLAWRLKNDVPFGSEKHKSMDFVSMLFSLIQDADIEEYIEQEKNKEIDGENQLFDDKNVVKMSNEEIAEAFDELDLDELNNISSDGNTKGDSI